MKRPAGTADWPQGPTLDNQGRSARVLTEQDVPVSKGGLCTAVFNTPTPCVLEMQISKARNSLDTYLKQSTDYPAKSVEADQVAGQLIVEYGSAGVLQTVVMDLKNGSFQLPPCEQVRVYFSTSIDDVGTDLDPIGVAAVLVPGFTACPTQPTYTIQHGTLTTSGYTTQIPDRARFVDLWLAGSTQRYGAGAPVLYLNGNDDIFPQVVRDYSTGIWAPPFPAPCFIQSDSAESGVTVDTTVACAAVIEFFLEL